MHGTILATRPSRDLPVIAAWLLIFLLASAPALRVGAVVRGASDGVPGSESIAAVDRAVAAGVPAGTFYPFIAVLHSDRQSVDSAQFGAAGRAISSALLGSGAATAVQSVWNTGDRRLVGRSAHSALLLIRPNAATFSEAELATAPLRAAVAAALPGGFSCEVTGQAAVLYDLNRRSSTDLLKAERIGLPLTLLILLIVFRSPVAALLPIALAMVATTVSMAALVVLSRFMLVSVFAENTITMIGLGVGIDYALLLVSAFRRALRSEGVPQRAARRAAQEVRPTLICSGAAVAIGFLALSLVRLPFLKALVFGGVLVVIAAVLATLTLLPAVLARLGSRIDWPNLSGRTVRRRALWRRWAQTVTRRPGRWAALALLILALLIAPVLRMAGWNLGASALAPDLEAQRGYQRLAQDLAPGWIGPTVLVLEAQPGHTVLEERARSAIGALAERLARSARLSATAADAPGSHGRIALLALVGADPPESKAASDLVKALRADPLPELAGTGLTARVSGAAAMLGDFDGEIFSKMWRVVPLVLLATFLALLVHLKSLLIPLKAIVLNLLSVLASYGFLILIFQDGHGSALLGIAPPGGLNAFIVLVLFTILFGLSMDYEVFLLSSIRQQYLRTGRSRQAVARGIVATGGMITSAAAIMVSLFLSFGFTRLIATREFGLGLAFAVALDATIVRLMLLPALMALFGRANWWLPTLRTGTPGR